MDKLSFSTFSWQIRKLLVYKHDAYAYAMGIVMSRTSTGTYKVKRIDTAGHPDALFRILEVDRLEPDSYVEGLYDRHPPKGIDDVREEDIIKTYPLPPIFEKFASDVYFDSSPAQDIPPEDLNFTRPIDDKQLRRTNPKRYDKRQDWYSEAPDSDLVNKYDNAIQGESSLKLGWQLPVKHKYKIKIITSSYGNSSARQSVKILASCLLDAYAKFEDYDLEEIAEIAGKTVDELRDDTVFLENVDFEEYDHDFSQSWIIIKDGVQIYPNETEVEDEIYIEASLDWEIENVISYGAFDGYDLVGKLIQKTSSNVVQEVLSYKDLPQNVRTFIKDYYHNELEEFPELVAHLNSLRVYGAERPRFYDDNVGAEYFDNENLILSYIPLEDLFGKYSRGLVHEIDHVVQYYLKGIGKEASIPNVNDPKYYSDNKFYIQDKAEIRARGAELAFEKTAWKIHNDNILDICNEMLHREGKWLVHKYVDYREISFDQGYKLFTEEAGRGPGAWRSLRSDKFFILERVFQESSTLLRAAWDLYRLRNGVYEELEAGVFPGSNLEAWLNSNTASLKFSWQIQDTNLRIGDHVITIKEIGSVGAVIPVGDEGRVTFIIDKETSGSSDDQAGIEFKSAPNFRWYIKQSEAYKYVKVVDNLKTSDLKDKNEKLFNERYQNYGDDGGNLFWSDTTSQYARFKLLSQVGTFDKASVLDVGAGFGDFLDYAQEYGIKIGLYVGIDIIPAIIAVAERKHPYDRFEVRDVVKTPFGDNAFDFIIGSGLFALEDAQWEQSVFDMINAMYKMAIKGVAVNFLSGNILSKEFRTTTEEEVLSIAHKVTDKVKVVSKLDDDITLYMYK